MKFLSAISTLFDWQSFYNVCTKIYGFLHIIVISRYNKQALGLTLIQFDYNYNERKYFEVNYTQEPEVETCHTMLPNQVIVIVIFMVMVMVMIMVMVVFIISMTGKAVSQRERKWRHKGDFDEMSALLRFEMTLVF